MIASQISKVLRYALNAFPPPAESKAIPELFEEKLNKLKTCLNKTTAVDVGFHEKYTSKQFWEAEHQAPIGYIDIYEDVNITIGIFILKPGMKMPLHDHPHMHGLLKVIAGQVNIHSYTVVDEADYVLSPETLPLLTITARKNAIVTANAQNGSIVLQPKVGNLHEIVCDKESAAAFIDVLSPPYETLIKVNKSTEETYLPRKCRFFEITEQLVDDFVQMKECKSPTWFWTSREEYLGPKVMAPKNDHSGSNVESTEDVNRPKEGSSVVEFESSDSAANRKDSDSN